MYSKNIALQNCNLYIIYILLFDFIMNMKYAIKAKFNEQYKDT